MALALGGCATTAQDSSSVSKAAPPFEVNVTNSQERTNGQPVIAVHPANPDNLVFVSTAHTTENGNLNRLACFAAFSQDGGESWSEVPWPYGNRPYCGDPYLAVDPDGTFFIAYNRLGCPSDPEAPLSTRCAQGPGHVGVSRSTDGGRNWSAPVDTDVARATTPRLRVDSANGHVYVSGGVGTRPSPHGISVSEDHGLTWQPTMPFPPQPFGNQMAVHDGIVATATALKIVDNSYVAADEVKFWASTNGGKAFTAYPVTDDNGNPAPPPSGRSMPDSKDLKASDPVPWVTADPTQRGRFALMLPHGDKLDVYMTPDAGETWTGPTSINAPGAAKPWIDFGPDGNLGVMWRTLRNDVSNVFATVSFDGGRSFGEPLKINRTPNTYGYPGSGGDEWSRILIAGSNVYLTWADARNGRDLDGILARVPLSHFRK